MGGAGLEARVQGSKKESFQPLRQSTSAAETGLAGGLNTGLHVALQPSSICRCCCGRGRWSASRCCWEESCSRSGSHVRLPKSAITVLKKIQSAALRMFRNAAIGLAIVQVLYLYVNSAVLVTSAEIGLRDIVGANFFLSGSIVFVGKQLFARRACMGSMEAARKAGI